MSVKKGFTLIELIMSIIVMGILYMYVVEADLQSEAKKAREIETQGVIELLNKFVYNSTSGYCTDKGGDCSDDYSVRNISAIRIKNCAQLNEYSVTETGIDQSDGGQSYFSLLQKYALSSGGGIKMSVDNVDDYEIKVFFDINTKDKGKLEQYIASEIKENLKSKVVVTYYNAESLTDTTYAGSPTDGKFRIHLKD